MESNTHLSTINRKICVYKSIVTSIDVDDFTVAHDITMQMQCTTYNCIDFGSVAIFVGGCFEWFEFFVKRLIPISWDRDLLTSYHFCTKKKTISNASILVSNMSEIEFKSIFLWIILEIFILTQNHWNDMFTTSLTDVRNT